MEIAGRYSRQKDPVVAMHKIARLGARRMRVRVCNKNHQWEPDMFPPRGGHDVQPRGRHGPAGDLRRFQSRRDSRKLPSTSKLAK
jgi:hypothetical protein